MSRIKFVVAWKFCVDLHPLNGDLSQLIVVATMLNN